MANYAIMRIDKRKLGAVNRIGKHNERLKSEYKSNPDIDRNKSHLNHHLKAPTGSTETWSCRGSEIPEHE